MFAGVTPPCMFTKVKTFVGLGKSRSKLADEMVTSPYGEPPFGGAKMPFTVRWSFWPVGISTTTVEPTFRSWLLAKSFETNAPSLPSCPGVSGLPACHLTLTTLEMSGATPVTLIRLPKARPSPARTPDTTRTPGTPFSAFADAIEIGEKLSCDVSA